MSTENAPIVTNEAAKTDTPKQGSPQQGIAEQTVTDLPAKPKRLIGSQRNPEAYRPKPTIPVTAVTAKTSAGGTVSSIGTNQTLVAPKTETYPPEGEKKPVKQAKIKIDDLDDELPEHLSKEGVKKLQTVPLKQIRTVDIPRRQRDGSLTDDLEAEFNAVFGDDVSIDAIMKKTGESAGGSVLESDTKVKAKILALQGDSVFFDVGAREQGIVLLKMFPADAELKEGDEMEVTIVRYLKEEGLYEVSVPLAAADVRDWSQLQEGMIVEAFVTKTNTGGLECEVNRLRGFMPISQIDMFRVENTEQYVGKKLTCIVEEVNVERRNLVLSRRSMLYREREEKRDKLLAELEVGQIREGLVRKIIDAGAFVDLGGVDGFLPIGAMSWGRIKHPSDVLSEGSMIKIRITKIDEEGRRISLTYRDDASNPWSNIADRFQEKTLARGKVSKIMEFGAFVELMPGVEGLIHISELSAKRVNNVHEIVKEGDWIDVYILSIEANDRRMSLSLKQATAAANAPASEESVSEETKEEVPAKIKNPYKGPLKGGTDQSTSGKFGLKW